VLFSGPDNPRIATSPSRIWTPSYYGSLGTPKSPIQTASRSVQLFLQVHKRDQQTDTQTTLLRL